MKTAIALAAMMLVSAAGVCAQETSASANIHRAGPSKPGKVVSKTHQPVGPPHKASSFAPRQTNRRVFGDPIQGPIVHNAPTPAKKPPAPK